MSDAHVANIGSSSSSPPDGMLTSRDRAGIRGGANAYS